MGKYADDTKVLDALLDGIATATIMNVNAGQPVDRNDATVTKNLADHVLTAGDFTKANGDSSGRKVTVAQQADFDIDATGTADHVSMSDAVTLLTVTTCASTPLSVGGTVTVNAHDYEVADPT